MSTGSGPVAQVFSSRSEMLHPVGGACPRKTTILNLMRAGDGFTNFDKISLKPNKSRWQSYVPLLPRMRSQVSAASPAGAGSHVAARRLPLFPETTAPAHGKNGAMCGRKNILILGGTTEASSLARRLAATPERFAVTTSLAGRTTSPAPLPGEVRIGGFGGADGLARYLRETGTDAVVDATHPFAARMPWNASEACARTVTPLLRLERPAWEPGPEDRWTSVPDLGAAAAALAGSRRIFLTTGRQELEPFSIHPDKWFLIRSIEPPDPFPLPRAEIVLAKGPFTVPEEEALMAAHAVDTLVTKNSGAQATAAKLEAARRLGLRVVMVERPPKPDGHRAATIAQALDWLDALPSTPHPASASDAGTAP